MAICAENGTNVYQWRVSFVPRKKLELRQGSGNVFPGPMTFDKVFVNDGDITKAEVERKSGVQSYYVTASTLKSGQKVGIVVTTRQAQNSQLPGSMTLAVGNSKSRSFACQPVAIVAG